MKKELKNTDKIMVSSRIPLYVKQYCEDKKLKIGDLIIKGFDEFRSTDVEHALTRLDYHEKRVLHWKGIVLHNEQECNTKYHYCNTIKKQFKEQGRGARETKRQDMFWIKAKSEDAIQDGIIISPSELYNICIGD